MNIFLIIFILYNVKFGYTRDKVSLFSRAEAQPGRSDCNRPETDDFLYHSCLDGPYPRDRTTCRCSSNYNQNFNFVCNKESDWVLQGSDKPCTDVLNPLTDYVDKFESKRPSFDSCNKPWEEVYYFHSCDKFGYPKSTTECYCSNNYPKKVTLICSSNKWYIGDWENKCRGKNKESTVIVRLDRYNSDKRKINYFTFLFPSPSLCKKPEEQLNFFHNCEYKNYPAERTSCSCTLNNAMKINLGCYGGIWTRGESEHCSYALLPNVVHCFKDSTNDVKCNCINSCFPLDIKKSLTHQQIHETCENSIELSVNDKEKHLISYYDGKNSKVKYNCESGFILEGSQEIRCNNGLLVNVIPNCRELTTPVHLDRYSMSNNSGTCYKPEPNLSVIHACSNVQVLESRITCFCTLNYPQKVDLICNGENWQRATEHNPCDSEYIDPNVVNCENTIEGKICRCKTNCFNLNMTGKFTYKQTTSLCSQTSISQQFKNKNLTLFYNDNVVKFVCNADDYEIIGDEEVNCNNGRLSANIPTCSLITEVGLNNSNEIYCETVDEEQVCRCKENCLQLNISEKLSKKKITELCSQNRYTKHFLNKNLITLYNENLVKFVCDGDDYELQGNDTFECNNGRLIGGNIPTCSARHKTKTEEIKELNLHKIIMVTVSSLLFIFAIILVIILYLRQKKNSKGKRNNISDNDDHTYEEIDLNEITSPSSESNLLENNQNTCANERVTTNEETCNNGQCHPIHGINLYSTIPTANKAIYNTLIHT